MKIALFSDVHANLPALEAFFKDLEAQKPDMVFCLGDLVGYNIWPNEVINAIRQRMIPTIAGNHDEEMGRMQNPLPTHELAQEQSNADYTNGILGMEERKYLHTLPSHMKLEFKLNGHHVNMLLVHGSPRKVNEYIFETHEETDLLTMMLQADAHILCFGHTHKPFHRILNDSDGTLRHAVNLGALGKPKDGDPRGCYAMLNINTPEGGGQPNIEVEFIRVLYDVEKAASAVEDSPLSNKYADMLRKAY